MYKVGLLSENQLSTYQQDGSPLSELVQANEELGFEASGGSLGLDASYAVGVALLAKKKGFSYRVYVEMGDGELDEGNVWEAIMAASQYKLDNLTMIIDANNVQLSGKTSDIMSWNNLLNRLESFGWNVISVNGHDCLALLDAFMNNHKLNIPLAVIANTIKGKGVSFMENDYHWHDHLLKGELLLKAREEVLGHA